MTKVAGINNSSGLLFLPRYACGRRNSGVAAVADGHIVGYHRVRV